MSEDQLSILDDLPEPQKQTVQALLVALQLEKSAYGSLPSPDILREYDRVIIGGAHRIIIMAEEKSRHQIAIELHQMAMEKIIIPAEIKRNKFGQFFAFIIALSFLAASTYLINTGKGIYGTILGGVDIVALVYVFINGKKEKEA